MIDIFKCMKVRQFGKVGLRWDYVTLLVHCTMVSVFLMGN